MKIKSLLTLAALFAVGVVFGQKTITIKGHVQFDEPRFKMSLVRQDGSEKIVCGEFDIDANNNFEYKFKVENPGVYTLDCKKWESIRFWAEDEDIEVNFRGLDTAKMKIKNPPFHMIKGGPKNEVMNHLNYGGYRNYQLTIAVSQINYRSKFESDEEKSANSGKLYDMCGEDMRARMKMLAEMYSDRTSVIALLPYINEVKDKELFDKICNDIFAKHPNYKPLTDYMAFKKDAAEKAKRMALGAPAPKFAYPTPDKKQNLGPDSFKGKILVIDFWASWCGPCRAEIPHMKEAYAMYKDKGVEFLSVSIDSKEADWMKALEAEKMAWPQVLAPSSGKEVSSLYQFSGIPFIIILDKEGQIYAKHLRGKALDKAIEELLSGKTAVSEDKTAKPMPAVGMMSM